MSDVHLRRTLRVLVAAAAAVLMVVPASAGAQVLQRATDSAGKGHFTNSGVRWKGVGWNDYRLMNHTLLDKSGVCGGAPMSTTDLGYHMDRIKATGANVVRTWFFQSYYQAAPSDNKWVAFNRILLAAKNRGMKVIPVLVNQWSACDRMDPAYVNKDEGNLGSWYYDDAYAGNSDGYKKPNWGYALSLRDWAAAVARQYNPDSGYASTIAFYEIANEAEFRWTATQPSRGADCPAHSRDVLRTFADDMTGVIKTAYVAGVSGRVPPLVAFGTMGIGQCGVSSQHDAFRHIHAGAVDVCDVHDYDAQTQSMPTWYEPVNGDTMARRIADCGSKPIMVGEVGIHADVRADGTRSGTVNSTTLNQRAEFLRQKMDAAYANGVDAYVVWDKTTFRSSDATGDGNSQLYAFGPGDPAECVVRSFSTSASCSSEPMPPVSSERLHYGFETDLDGFVSDWGGLSIGRSTYTANQGTYSMSVQMANRSDARYAAVATYQSLTEIDTGTTVTYYVWSATDTSTVMVRPFVKNSAWSVVWGGSSRGLVNGWNKLQFTVPTVDVVKALGFQFENPNGQTGTLHVDHIRW